MSHVEASVPLTSFDKADISPVHTGTVCKGFTARREETPPQESRGARTVVCKATPLPLLTTSPPGTSVLGPQLDERSSPLPYFVEDMVSQHKHIIHRGHALRYFSPGFGAMGLLAMGLLRTSIF